LELIKTVPDIFLPYQKAWIADKSSFKVCEKARRIGITWAEAADDVLLAATSGRAGSDVFYIGYNEDMTREYIDTASEWAKHFQLVVNEIEEFFYDDKTRHRQDIYENEDKDILTFRISFASGNEIVALSSAPRNLRSKQGRIVIDEAAFHDDLGGLIKAALAMKIWGGQTVVISTHNGVNSEFNQLIGDIKAKKRPGSVHRYTFDDAIRDGLCERIFYVREKEWSKEAEEEWQREVELEYKEDADEELRCIPAKSGGKYLSVGLIEECSHDAPVLRLEYEEDFTWKDEVFRKKEIEQWCQNKLNDLLFALPDDCHHSFGEDFGRSGDMTALVPMTITQKLKRVIPFVVELRNVPYQQQQQIVFYIISRLPRLTKAAFDATGNGEQLVEVTAQFFGKASIMSVKLTEKAYSEVLPPFKAAFQDHRILVPRDSDIRDDLLAFEIINGIPKLPKILSNIKKPGNKKNKAKRHGDVAIAAALAYYASLQDFTEYDYQSVKQQNIVHLRKKYPQPKITAGFGAKRGIW
jgi:phage FluMu gp28-like protein